MRYRGDFVSNSSAASFVVDIVDTVNDYIPFDIFKKAILMCFDEKLHEDKIRIYDMSDEKKFDEIIEKERDYLKGWDDKMNPKLDEFNHVLDTLKDYGKAEFDTNKVAWQQDSNVLAKPVIQTINILRKNMEIQSMLEVAQTQYDKILICMSENLIYTATGFDKKKNPPDFYTDPYTPDRFVELVSKKLWELDYPIDYRDLRHCFHGNQHLG